VIVDVDVVVDGDGDDQRLVFSIAERAPRAEHCPVSVVAVADHVNVNVNVNVNERDTQFGVGGITTVLIGCTLAPAGYA
jgi:hypothetical protein